LVTLNFTAVPQSVSFDLEHQGVPGKHIRTIIASFSSGEAADLNHMILPPYGAYVGEVKQ
jgi:hypothetical protein